MTYDRLLQIFQNYVDNDYEASDESYIRDALGQVATKEEIEELDFGWVYDENEDDE